MFDFNLLKNIIMNKIFISVILAWILANIIQIADYYIRHNKINVKRLYDLGSFPSRHCTAVSALSSAVLFSEGASTIFIAVLVFSAIIVRDALERHTLKEASAGIAIGLIVAASVFYL